MAIAYFQYDTERVLMGAYEGQRSHDHGQHAPWKIDDVGEVYYGGVDSGQQAKKACDTAWDKIAGYSGAICAAYTGVENNLDLMNANLDVANWASVVGLPPVSMNVRVTLRGSPCCMSCLRTGSGEEVLPLGHRVRRVVDSAWQ